MSNTNAPASPVKKDKLVTAPIQLHRILREVLRHYTEYKALVDQHSLQDTIDHGVIDHGYWVYNEDGTKHHKENVTISFWDLHRGLKELAPRKREAIFYNVILDEKQKDVAKRMGITTVSVGQYVEAGCQQLAKKYFPEANDDDDKG